MPGPARVGRVASESPEGYILPVGRDPPLRYGVWSRRSSTTAFVLSWWDDVTDISYNLEDDASLAQYDGDVGFDSLGYNERIDR